MPALSAKRLHRLDDPGVRRVARVVDDLRTGAPLGHRLAHQQRDDRAAEADDQREHQQRRRRSARWRRGSGSGRSTLMTMPSTSITARLVITKSRIRFMVEALVCDGAMMGTAGAELKTGRQYCQTGTKVLACVSGAAAPWPARLSRRTICVPRRSRLEQLRGLDQVEQLAVAVVARVEGRLVADLLAHRSPAPTSRPPRPPIPPRCAAGHQPRVLLQRRRVEPRRRRLGRRPRRCPWRRPQACAPTWTRPCRRPGRRPAAAVPQVLQVQEARAGVDEGHRRLLARRSRRPARPWPSGASPAA